MTLKIVVPIRWLAIALTLLGLSACEGTGDSPTDIGTSTGLFSFAAVSPANLTEGDTDGVDIPLVLDRRDGHNDTISLSIADTSDTSNGLMSLTLAQTQLSTSQDTSSLTVRLAIGDVPIMPEQITVVIRATDGESEATIPLKINIQPVDAPDIYLLIGQSNMVGFSGDGTKIADQGGPDEPNPRILQLNVTKNNQFDIFATEESYTTTSSNIIEANSIVRAEDPLHIPLDPNNTSGKDLSYIGLGLSFAKTALNNTTADIVLVPAAWSGSAFCFNDNGPIGQWNAQTPDNPDLGNTLLFDRAVTRTNLAIDESAGILRGILWHQGESDANERCAGEYLANLERLAQQLRLRIKPDRRGEDHRQADSNIPFVLGTMSRGVDERGDLSEFWVEKQRIDDAHKTLPSQITHAAVTISDDLTPDNGYPCGNSDCIHFGARALREMGSRYYEALQRAVTNP